MCTSHVTGWFNVNFRFLNIGKREKTRLPAPSHPVLWNCNYFLRFRVRLLKSYGSGSDFWKSYGSSSGSGFGSYFWKVTVPVPVPAPYLYHKKQIFLKKFVSFLHSKLFYKEKDYKYQQIYCKIWKKKMLNEGNQIHNFISSSGSGTVINYGSGSGSDFLTSYGSGSRSTRQKVTVPTVPIPQQCSHPSLTHTLPPPPPTCVSMVLG
jgi:hypothetical protein